MNNIRATKSTGQEYYQKKQNKTKYMHKINIFSVITQKKKKYIIKKIKKIQE